MTSDVGFPEPLDLVTLLSGPPPVVPYVWKPYLARGDVGGLVGDAGIGKSLLALALGTASRHGVPLLGSPCERIRVGIFDYENPLTEVHKRLLGFGVSATDSDGLLYFHMPRLDLINNAEMIAALVEQHRLDLIIIDSLRRAAPGLQENDSASMSAALAPLRRIANSNRSVLLIHHAKKRGADSPQEASQLVRGSGDIVANVDSLLFVRANPKEPGRSFTLEHAKSRRGLAAEPILVRIENDDGRIDLVNAGPIATADDAVEATLSKIIAALRDEGSPLERQILGMRVAGDPKDGSFNRALKLGWQRNLLTKTNEDTRKPNEPLLYGLTEWAT